MTTVTGSDDLSPVLSTGVPGLDEVLAGGLLRNGLHLVEGRAGSGKTILASQIAFHRAAQGDKVLYLTVLAESHGKLISHLRRLAFFDETLVPSRFEVLSGYQPLLDKGLDGLLGQVLRVVQEESPALLVIDGFRAAAGFAEDETRLGRFLHQLDGVVSGARCTTLLLSPLEGSDPRPEHTLVDGLFELSVESRGLRRARLFEVRKLRGANHHRGRHLFRIGADGIRVYPRIEARVTAATRAVEEGTERVTLGIPALDEMMGGGVMRGSTTAVLGGSGAGKTLIGLSFLHHGLGLGEAAVYFGFYETPQRLVAKAAGVGLDLEEAVTSGRLVLQWQPPLELVTDALAELLLQHVRRTNARRVFIDGIEGFRDSATHPERFQMVTTAIAVCLRAAGVTTYFSQELPLFSKDNSVLDQVRISAVMENILLLRHAHVASRLRRLLSVMKMRDAAHDADVHEFTISDQGFTIGPRFERQDDPLEATPREPASRR
jgi:circadian clock protein KaiC